MLQKRKQQHKTLKREFKIQTCYNVLKYYILRRYQNTQKEIRMCYPCSGKKNKSQTIGTDSKWAKMLGLADKSFKSFITNTCVPQIKLCSKNQGINDNNDSGNR